MGLKDLIQNSVWRMDLLSATPTFRTRQQPVYETVFGGLLSIVVLGFFYYFLCLQLHEMLNKLTISFSQGVDDNVSSTSAITSFPFAVAIEGVDLAVSPKKFIFELVQTKIIAGVPALTPLSLSPCNASDWEGYGSNFASQFNAFGFGQMLCPTSGQSISLAGYAGTEPFSYLSLRINACNQTLDGTCDTPSNINTYMTSHINTNDYFKVKFFALDTILTPSNDQAVSYVLEKNIFMAFSTSMGTVGSLFMAEYSLETDRSYLPYQNFQIDTGNYIESYQTNAVSLATTRYINLEIFRSTKSLTVTRTIGKIDSVLSYVGGLFSLLFTCMAFLFGSYSQYKYELYVAEATLTNNKGRKFKTEDFGFFTYVAYACYDWMATFGIAPDCLKKVKNIH